MAAGAALYLLQALGKAIRLQLRLKQIRRPLPPQLMIEQIEKLSQLWNYPDGFKVWLVEGITQPFVWGLWRGRFICRLVSKVFRVITEGDCPA